MIISNNSNNKNNNSNSENDSENKNEIKNENKNENENENENDDYEIKQINNCFKMNDKTKSFQEQINLLRK